MAYANGDSDTTTTSSSNGDLPIDGGGGGGPLQMILSAAGSFGDWLSSNFGLSDAEAATMQQILKSQQQTQKAVLYVSLLSIATGGFVVYQFTEND